MSPFLFSSPSSLFLPFPGFSPPRPYERLADRALPSARPALVRVTPAWPVLVRVWSAGVGQGHPGRCRTGSSRPGLVWVGRVWSQPGRPVVDRVAFWPFGRWVCRKRLAGPAWPALVVRGQGDTSRAVDRRVNQASHRRLDTVGRSRTGSPPGYLWRFDRPWEAPMAGREGQGRRPVHRESVGWGWTADQRPQGPSTSETG